jgi:hypothetical protein
MEVSAKEAKEYFCYYRINYDREEKRILSYQPDDKAVPKTLRLSGFIAILSYRIEGDSKHIWDLYHFRDEQEKFFSQRAARRTLAWS